MWGAALEYKLGSSGMSLLALGQMHSARVSGGPFSDEVRECGPQSLPSPKKCHPARGWRVGSKTAQGSSGLAWMLHDSSPDQGEVRAGGASRKLGVRRRSGRCSGSRPWRSEGMMSLQGLGGPGSPTREVSAGSMKPWA